MRELRLDQIHEQLELRQTSQGSLYPQVGMGPFAAVATDGLSPAVSLYMRWIDAWARALLRHIAHDLGASPRFFEALCDPQPAGAAADAAGAAAAALSPPLASQLELDCFHRPLHIDLLGSGADRETKAR